MLIPGRRLLRNKTFFGIGGGGARAIKPRKRRLTYEHCEAGIGTFDDMGL